MSKKDFKSGLDALLQSTIEKRNQENKKKVKEAIAEPRVQNNGKVLKLEKQLELLQKELFYWRTGKLTLENFEESLAKKGLKYDAETNTISKAD